MLNPPIETSGITIATDISRDEAPPIPAVVIAAIGAKAETLKQRGITRISRRVDQGGQEFYVPLGNPSEQRREEVRAGLQEVSEAAHGTQAFTARSNARLTYASFTVPAFAA